MNIPISNSDKALPALWLSATGKVTVTPGNFQPVIPENGVFDFGGVCLSLLGLSQNLVSPVFSGHAQTPRLHRP